MSLLASLWKRATPENPSFSLNSPEAWDTFLGGNRSSSGVRVNREMAFTHSPWWRGVNLIARDCGRLPQFVFARNGEAKRRAIEHPAYFLVRHKPNDFQTANIFRMLLTSHAVTSGNGFAYIFRNGDGSPKEILPLNPDQTYCVRENEVVTYVTQIGTENRKLLKENVLHIKGLGFDGMTGYSVFEKARETLGQGMGVQKFNTIFFRNAAKPAVILTHPGKLPDKTKSELRSDWERMQTGLENSHRTAILDGGLDLKELTVSARNAQMIEVIQWNIKDVSNFLCIPPHKLGDSGTSSYSSLEQENQQYLDECLSFWISQWNFECWDKLLTEKEKLSDTHLVDFDLRALMGANLEALGNYLNKALGGHPFVMVNEARGMMNMNPVDGFNVIPEPLNMGPDKGGADNDKKPLPTKPAKDGDDGDLEDEPDGEEGARQARLTEAHRAVLTDAAGRMVRRLTHAARRAAKKPTEFVRWLDTLETEHENTVREAFSAPLQAISALRGTEKVPEMASKPLFLRVKNQLLEASGAVTARDLEAKIDSVSAQLEAELPGFLAETLLN